MHGARASVYVKTSLLKRSSVRTCSSGPGRPSPIVLTHRCVMPRIARQAAISFARSSGGNLSQGHAPLDPERGRIAARLPDEAVETVHGLLGGGARAEGLQRDPAVREAGRAAEDRLGLAPHPDGNRPLDGQRLDARVGHAVPPALVGHQLAGPEEPHDLELLLDPPAAIVDVLAERLELDRVPADADAQAQPAAREHVHLGRLLGDERRLALGQDEDAGDQLDAPRDRRRRTRRGRRARGRRAGSRTGCPSLPAGRGWRRPRCRRRGCACTPSPRRPGHSRGSSPDPARSPSGERPLRSSLADLHRCLRRGPGGRRGAWDRGDRGGRRPAC